MKWMRPSGEPIETNDEPGTIEHCESIGWKREEKETPWDEAGEESAPRRGRKPKNSQRD